MKYQENNLTIQFLFDLIRPEALSCAMTYPLLVTYYLLYEKSVSRNEF